MITLRNFRCSITGSMSPLSKKFSCLLLAVFLAPAASPAHGQDAAKNIRPPAADVFPNVLYGAAYYHEYEPYERLDQDVAMMQQAAFLSCAWANPHGAYGSQKMAISTMPGWIVLSTPWARLGLRSSSAHLPTRFPSGCITSTRNSGAPARRSAAILWHAPEHGYR